MNYQYTGKNKSGQTISGKIEAESKQEALLELENNNLIILNIEETRLWNKDIVFNNKVNNRDFVIFLRQYATLIHAGIPISDATKTMHRQTESKALQRALADMDRQLDQGEALSKSSEHHPKIFPPLLVNMIRAGEASGQLDEILNQMADYYEKVYRNRQKVISALIYPSVVGVITMLVSLFLLVFIVPQFVSMFESFGEEIPAFTQFVLNVSDLVGTYWWALMALIFLVSVMVKFLMRYESFAYRMDVMKMKFPFVGVLVHKSVLVRMTQTLSTLVNSAVPFLQAVEITEKVVENRVAENVLKQSRNALEVGESITVPMREHWAFPPLVVQMIQIGEKTGTLDQMLAKAAEFYEEEVEQLSNRLKTLIEPLMIIILTVIVGSIIAAVIIPMFSLFENIQ
ncbi:type II secretion system F family protein [Lentibacillus lipolyticus]|nr:type II secretion system F family protein [Lentibacillus lipolyticus]